jgi:hypothetical protein
MHHTNTNAGFAASHVTSYICDVYPRQLRVREAGTLPQVMDS